MKYAIESPTKPYILTRIIDKKTNIIDHSNWNKIKWLVLALATRIFPSTQQFILMISPSKWNRIKLLTKLNSLVNKILIMRSLDIYTPNVIIIIIGKVVFQILKTSFFKLLFSKFVNVGT